MPPTLQQCSSSLCAQLTSSPLLHTMRSSIADRKDQVGRYSSIVGLQDRHYLMTDKTSDYHDGWTSNNLWNKERAWTSICWVLFTTSSFTHPNFDTHRLNRDKWLGWTQSQVGDDLWVPMVLMGEAPAKTKGKILGWVNFHASRCITRTRVNWSDCCARRRIGRLNLVDLEGGAECSTLQMGSNGLWARGD
jgi:hypothetical protein